MKKIPRPGVHDDNHAKQNGLFLLFIFFPPTILG